MGWAQAFHPTIKRTVQHRLDILEEEFDAWNRGAKLATKLKLKIDKTAYGLMRAKCMKSYVMWAARSNNYDGPIITNKEMKDEQE